MKSIMAEQLPQADETHKLPQGGDQYHQIIGLRGLQPPALSSSGCAVILITALYIDMEQNFTFGSAAGRPQPRESHPSLGLVL